ncbi:hypothetical protein OIU85_027252 [Salix viminalis]|uniref:Uncharacterized protein n=1 Tax=Salix viminalis TaxID=40686 RepID=A0A9Q0QHW6_SALVM|nr:hypothetical protein OIU85_027252 [Salix viminalis]
MGFYHVILSTHGLSWYKLAVLEHRRCIATYEVYRAGDIAISVQLPGAVGKEGALGGINAAKVDDEMISSDPECFVFLWPSCVL